MQKIKTVKQTQKIKTVKQTQKIKTVKQTQKIKTVKQTQKIKDFGENHANAMLHNFLFYFLELGYDFGQNVNHIGTRMPEFSFWFAIQHATEDQTN